MESQQIIQITKPLWKKYLFEWQTVQLAAGSSSEELRISVFVTSRSNTYFVEESPPPLTATSLEILFRISDSFIFCDPKCTV